MPSAIYTRTISREEADEGFFMILKDRLAFFPLSGSSFELHHGGTITTAAVESSGCTCRGADKPHRHYFVRCNGLVQGDQITVRKDQKKSGRYVMQVRSAVSQREFCG